MKILLRCKRSIKTSTSVDQQKLTLFGLKSLICLKKARCSICMFLNALLQLQLQASSVKMVAVFQLKNHLPTTNSNQHVDEWQRPHALPQKQLKSHLWISEIPLLLPSSFQQLGLFFRKYKSC